MTISPWTIYWITILDSVGLGIFLFGVIGVAVGFTGYFLSQDPWNKKPKDSRFLIPAFIGIGFIAIDMFLPASKDMAAILIIPKIANNAKVQQVPSKILDLANEWLDALKPKGDKK